MELTTNPVQVGTLTASGPSLADVRARVLAEHARLRALIAEVDRLASAVAAGESYRTEALRERADRLYRMLTEHIDHEDAVVAPIIARIDAWGSVRLEQMQHDHAGQRMLLKQAAHDLGIEGRHLGQVVQSMCWEILHDMKREEHDLLHPDLWSDNPIVVEIGA
ncbi:MAG TPA: hemerythrin domain-containing protein [Polyangiaceae bacterium]